MKALAILAAAAIASSASAAEQPWQPSMAAAVDYASHRHGVIAFAVRTPTRHWGWHVTEIFPSASVVKTHAARRLPRPALGAGAPASGRTTARCSRR